MVILNTTEEKSIREVRRGENKTLVAMVINDYSVMFKDRNFRRVCV